MRDLQREPRLSDAAFALDEHHTAGPGHERGQSPLDVGERILAPGETGAVEIRARPRPVRGDRPVCAEARERARDRARVADAIRRSLGEQP